jgi:hypothetical protein
MPVDAVCLGANQGVTAMTTNRNGSIAGGVTGIIGWVLFFIAFALAPTPPTLGAPAKEVLAYATEHHTSMLWAAFLFGATAPFLMTWTGALAARLRDAEGEGAWLYLVFLATAVATSTISTAASFVWMTLSGRGWSAGDAITQTLSDMVNYGYIFIGFGSVAFVPAASVVMIRTGEVARTLGYIGLAVTVLQAVYLFTAFFTDGLMAGGGPITIMGFTVLGLWLLAVAIAMIVRAPAGRKLA